MYPVSFWSNLHSFPADAGPDNGEKLKTNDAVDVGGPGSADCLALHKKGLYIAGQVK